MKAMWKFGVGLAIVLSLLACQTTGGPSDEILLAQLLDSVKESLVTQDIDRFMSLYSENYSDSQGANKQAIRDNIGGIMATGALDGIEISLEDATIVLNDDGTASASQVKVMGSGFSITLSYTFVKEEGSWLILSAETSGF